MLPKSWPKRLNYARESCSPEVHYCILQQYLRSPNPEDLHKTSRVIEQKCVHPHVQIKKITASIKTDEHRSHPLANVKTKLGHSNYGVFALKKIHIGEEIGEYVGEIFIEDSLRQIHVKSHGFSEYKWRWVVDGVSFLIDAQPRSNELALINDYRGLGCAPNLQIVTIIHKGYFYFGYAACRDINRGEELLVDYGETFWKAVLFCVKKQ